MSNRENIRSNKHKIFINAISSVLNVIVYSIALFIVYRFLLRTIGVERIGIWSLVFSMVSVASLVNLGFAEGVVKYVSKYLALNQIEKVSRLVQTAFITLAILLGGLLLLFYPFANWILNLLLPKSNMKEALSILPYALLTLWISWISRVFQASLDGFQLIAQKNIILIVATFFHLFICFMLVPEYGLDGLAYSHVLRAFFILLGCWVFLKRTITVLPLIRYRWDRPLFREMLGYSMNFQVISISQMILDPITKGLLTKFGGLSMTGFYDMASRMLSYIRLLISSAVKVIVPAIADLHERNAKSILLIYKMLYRFIFYITIPIFTILIIFLPFISQVWIGYYEIRFIYFSIFLSIGFSINLLSHPAYFVNAGTGHLKWNTIGHIVIAVLNFILGILLGIIFNGRGVVFAYALSLIIGSVLIASSYNLNHGIPLKNLIPKENFSILIATIIGIPSSFLLYHFFLNSNVNQFVTIFFPTVPLSIILIFFLWSHPMRKYMFNTIAHEYSGIK